MEKNAPRVLMLHSSDQPTQPVLGRLRAAGWDVVLTAPGDLERFHRALGPRLVLVPASWDAQRCAAWMATAPQTLLAAYGEGGRSPALHLGACDEDELEGLLELADAQREGVLRLAGLPADGSLEEELPRVDPVDPDRVLRRDLERLLALVDGAGEAMVAIGAEGCILFCNPAAEELLGAGALGALGRPCEQVLPPWLLEGLLRRCSAAGVPAAESRWSVRVEGLTGEILVRVRTLDARASRRGERLVFLEHRAVPSRECATPAEWARVDSILRGGVRLEEWLDLCAGQGLERGSFESAAAMRGMRRLWERKARRRGLKLRWSVPARVGAVRLRGAARRLRRALEELLDNALRFTPRGGEVAFAVERLGGGLHWRVENGGARLNPGELERARSEFVRLRDPLDGSPLGPGLGLPIAEECLLRLGSRLGLECGEKGGVSAGFWTEALPEGDRPGPRDAPEEATDLRSHCGSVMTPDAERVRPGALEEGGSHELPGQG